MRAADHLGPGRKQNHGSRMRFLRRLARVGGGAEKTETGGKRDEFRFEGLVDRREPVGPGSGRIPFECKTRKEFL